MTSDSVNCYHYNEANQLDKVTNCTNSQTIAEYVYDYNGNRMVKKNYNNGTWNNNVTSWSDSFETKVATGGATENTTYYFVNDQLAAKKDNSGTKTYFQDDHLGSEGLVTNQSGSLVENTSYYPFGEIRSGGTASKYLYTGQERDNETGLDYYNARYYSDHIRRFTQPDTYVSDMYNPQDLNEYSYVLNNPLRYTDPTGHYVETVLDVAFIGMDLNDIRKDSTNPWNYVALGGDVVGAALPGLTGVGLGIKLVEHGAEAAKVAEKAGDTGKAAQNVVKQITDNAANIGKNSANQNNGNKIAGKITGYTKHGIDQAISRDNGKGVATSAILNAVRHPQSVVKQTQGTIKYIGKQTTVVLNKIGKVVTTWGTPRKR